MLHETGMAAPVSAAFGSASLIDALCFQLFQQSVNLGNEFNFWIRYVRLFVELNVNIHAIAAKPERDHRLVLSQTVSSGPRHDQRPQRLAGAERLVITLLAHLRDQAADLRSEQEAQVIVKAFNRIPTLDEFTFYWLSVFVLISKLPNLNPREFCSQRRWHRPIA
jgi:hypothetical protein